MFCLRPAIVCITTVLVLIQLDVAASEAADDSTLRHDLPAVVAEIRAEVTKKTSDLAGRPLPVVAHWANGFGRPNFSSDYQISLLERGHHIVPTLPFPRPDARRYDEAGRPWVEKLARWKAPFSLRAGQWESVLYEEEHPVDAPGKWRNLPPEKNPRVIDAEGKLIRMLSPWGAVEPWYEAGVYHTSSPAFRQLEQWYPDPPLVILLSNNEAGRLEPKHDVEKTSRRYLERYGTGRSAEFVRGVMAEGYLERYAALLDGIRDGLQSDAWRARSLRVAYEAFGPPHLGRWSGWSEYSYSDGERIDPWHLVWDGGSPSYYTHNWNASTDYRVWSPQVEANNWPFMLEAAYRQRPDFWFELSIWDGNEAKSSQRSKRAEYQKAGQRWSSERYAGFVQYGLWLLTPRAIREFRGSTVPREDFGRDFEALVAAVDLVWQDPVLTRFWRKSELVPNRSQKHPYQTDIPERWRDADRWYMLDTSLDPPRPWTLETELPVFSLARVLGSKGKREWLVYAHAPVEARRNVRIEIPGYRDVTVDVVPGGSFYLVGEEHGIVTPVAVERK